jgi:hypothetical protein
MISENGRTSWQSRFLQVRAIVSFAVVALSVAGGVILGCGEGILPSSTSTSTSTSTTTPMAKVSIKLSDPATCMAPTGPYAHVYVALTDVEAHTNANAGADDAGWVDLTPGLSKSPQQIDLLGLANNQCFLATLGDSQQLQAGNYQQIRVILADDTAVSSGKGSNACLNWANCVVLTDGSVYPLLLSSEAKTGIKITSGQIANGNFSVAAGETKDLDIDFDTCASIVQEGQGKYRLKPVLHAGEVSTTASSINGAVVDSATGKQIVGTVTVALEQKDATGIDRIFMSTLVRADGTFIFCPLPIGTYDVVIVGSSTSGVVYSPTVITGVTTGSAIPVAPLYAPAGGLSVTSILTGKVTSQNAANPLAGTAIHVELSALETLSSSLTVTVPLVPTSGDASVTLARATASGVSCAAGTDCANYSMRVPVGATYSGAFSASGSTVTQSLLPAAYKVDGIAFVPSSGGVLSCSPSELTSTAVTAVAGAALPVGPLAFTGCQ